MCYPYSIEENCQLFYTIQFDFKDCPCTCVVDTLKFLSQNLLQKRTKFLFLYIYFWQKDIQSRQQILYISIVNFILKFHFKMKIVKHI